MRYSWLSVYSALTLILGATYPWVRASKPRTRHLRAISHTSSYRAKGVKKGMSRQGNRIQLEALQGWLGTTHVLCLLCWLGLTMAMPAAHATSPLAASVAPLVLDQAGAVWQVSHSATQSVLIQHPSQPKQAAPVKQRLLPLMTHAMPLTDPLMLAGITDSTRITRDAAGQIWVTWVTPALAGAPAQLMLFRLNVDATQPTATLAMAPKALLVLPLPARAADCLAMPQLAVQGAHVLLAWAYQCVGESAMAAAAPLYFVTSVDQGEHFSAPRSVANSQVVCGEIAVTAQLQQGFALLWRQRFAATESDLAMTSIDHALLTQSVSTGAPDALPMVRASFAHASSVTCGAPSISLAVGEGFGYHFSYVEPSPKHSGLKRARMDGEAWVTSPAYTVAAPSQQPDAPRLLSVGEQVWLLWRAHLSEGDAVMGLLSQDGGKTWGAPLMQFNPEQAVVSLQALMHDGEPSVLIETAAHQHHLLPLRTQ